MSYTGHERICESMFICIGKIVDAHSLKGEVKVRFISEHPEWIDDLMTIYLSLDEKGQNLKPNDASSFLDIINIRKTNELWILQLEGVTDRNQAEALKRQYVFVEESFFKTNSEQEPYLLELQGYEVVVGDQVQGTIIGFLETPAHNLILIKNDQGEFEIPWVDPFIQEVQREPKKVIMTFPLDLLSDDYNVRSK